MALIPRHPPARVRREIDGLARPPGGLARLAQSPLSQSKSDIEGLAKDPPFFAIVRPSAYDYYSINKIAAGPRLGIILGFIGSLVLVLLLLYICFQPTGRSSTPSISDPPQSPPPSPPPPPRRRPRVPDPERLGGILPRDPDPQRWPRDPDPQRRPRDPDPQRRPRDPDPQRPPGDPDPQLQEPPPRDPDPQRPPRAAARRNQRRRT